MSHDPLHCILPPYILKRLADNEKLRPRILETIAASAVFRHRPGGERVRVDHQQDGQAARPVEISEARRGHRASVAWARKTGHNPALEAAPLTIPSQFSDGTLA